MNNINKKNYFKGWYFKQNSKDLNISFIPSFSIVDKKEKKCFIQVITQNFSDVFEFTYDQLYYDEKNLYIKIGDNIFSNNLIQVNLKNQNYHIIANLTLGPLTKIKRNIMGPFYYFPFMECKHKIYSMKHNVSGDVIINNEMYNLKNATGYLESDYGSSFPSNYTWIQCNSFNDDTSLFFSKATIPYLILKFQGHICSVIIKNKEYRFATYNFSKIIKTNKNTIELKKGKYKLEINYSYNHNQKLIAPKNGSMKRIIHESLNGSCNIILKYKNKEIYKNNGELAGIEISEHSENKF